MASIGWRESCGSVAVWCEVLVKLAHVKSVDGPNDISAEVCDVYITEVDVLTAGWRDGASVRRSGNLAFGFWCTRRCWRSIRLTWKPEIQKYQQISTNNNALPLKKPWL